MRSPSPLAMCVSASAVIAFASCSVWRSLDYLGSEYGRDGGVESGLGEGGPADARTDARRSSPLDQLCPDAGWCHIANTQLTNACPPPGFDSPCDALAVGNGGTIFDQERDRLLVFNGESTHRTNEVYSINLAPSPSVLRLTDPQTDTPCGEATTLGTPSPRAPYDGVASVAHADRLFMFGGVLTCDTGISDATWTLNLATSTWEKRPAGGAIPGKQFGISADYDPVTGSVFLAMQNTLHRYDYDSNRYEALATHTWSQYGTARVDPERRLFVHFGFGGTDGTGIRAHKLDQTLNYPQEDWTAQVQGTEECKNILLALAPGVAFDPTRRVFVVWPNRGDAVALFDPETKSCVINTFPGGPVPASNYDRTLGRFRYVASAGVFVLVYDSGLDVMALRLPP